MSRKSFTVRLGGNHDAWYKLAEQLDQRPATLATLVLNEVLNSSQKDFNEVTHLKRDPYYTGVYIRPNTQQDIERIDLYADALGVSRSKAMLEVLRSLVEQEPIFDNEAKQLLAESNHLLKMISINVNQIAHVLNTYEAQARNGTPSPLDIYGLEKSCKVLMLSLKSKTLKKFIATHVACVQALIRACTLKNTKGITRRHSFNSRAEGQHK